jgi:paraquat-inducible protein B
MGGEGPLNHTRKDESPVVGLAQARIKNRKHIPVIWIVPILAAIASGWLILDSALQTGPLISISFGDGNGLQGNQTVLRYRGVKVGEVRSVQLTKDAQQVEVEARLDESAASLACEGSQFWVVRPEVGSGGLSGLETIVSGAYIQIQPGNGKRQKKFTGLDHPPIIKPNADGVEIVVTTPELRTLSTGAPIFYRGIVVGTVWYFELNDDSSAVNVHLLIDSNFAPLVRTDSKFWNAGGLNVDLKFFHVDISAQSFKSLLVGGIAFATPTTPGSVAPAGSVFTLYDKMDDKWSKWSPTIQVKGVKAKVLENGPSPAILNEVNQIPKQ